MCIIAIKPKGKKMMDDYTIKSMFINNPDGAGYMYYDYNSKKVVIKKGFMTCKSLLASLHSKDFTNTNVILHFRIGTSGFNDALNCHPYPIYQKNALKVKTDLAMAHNGILHDFTPPKTSDINDTQVFIRDVLSTLKPGFLKDNDKVNLISKLIGTNKLAFLDDKNKVYTIGNFITDGDYTYSNGTYKVYPTYPVYRGVTTYSQAFPSTTKVAKKVTPVNDSTCETKKHKMSKYEWDFWNDSPNDFWDDWDKRHPYGGY